MDNILDLYSHTDVWLLIFTRIVAAITIMPLITETKVPATVVGIISMTLTMIVFFGTSLQPIYYGEDIVGFALVLIKEIIVGFIIGYSMIIYFQIYNWAGQLLSNQGGLSMSTFYDPSIGAQIPLLGKFLTLCFSAVFVLSGGYHWFITALVKTFEYIPVGEAIFNPELLTNSIIDAVSIFFETGFRLALPIVGVIFLIDMGLGILARAAPQMNMFVIGFPIKLMILMTLLILITQILPGYNNLIIELITDLFFNIIRGLS